MYTITVSGIIYPSFISLQEVLRGTVPVPPVTGVTKSLCCPVIILQVKTLKLGEVTSLPKVTQSLKE